MLVMGVWTPSVFNPRFRLLSLERSFDYFSLLLVLRCAIKGGVARRSLVNINVVFIVVNPGHVGPPRGGGA
jgi:hypothetical protein